MKNKKNKLLKMFLLFIALFITLPIASPTFAKSLSGKLDVYVFSGPIKKIFWEAAISEFNARYPDVKVKLVAIPKIHDQVRPRLVAGNPPDIYFSAGAGRIGVGQLYNEGLILQLDRLLDEKNWEGSQKFRDTILSYRFDVLDGKTWGIQLPFHMVGLYYHEPTFKKHGWNVPTNFNEFQALAAKIQSKGIAPLSTTGIYPYYVEHFIFRGAVAAAGGKQAFLDWVELKPGFFTSDVFKGVVERFHWTVNNGHLLKGASAMNHIESEMEWVLGRAAFTTSGTWIESELAKNFPEGYKEGVRYVPSFFVDSGQKMIVSPYGNASMTIFQGGNEEAAKEFLKALYSKKVMALLTKHTNILSNVPEANKMAEKSPALTSAVNWMNELDQIPWPQGGYLTQEVTKTMQSLIQSLMAKEINADEFTKKMEKVAERIRNDKSVTFLKAYFPQ